MAANALDLTRNFVSLCPLFITMTTLSTTSLHFLPVITMNPLQHPTNLILLQPNQSRYPQRLTIPAKSLYTIPAAWVLAIVPHFYAASLGKFDNRTPRAYTKEIADDKSLSPETRATIIRAEGAQQNGFENIGLFAAAVVAGNIAGLENRTLNLLSGGYLVSRIVYNFVYIGNTTEQAATLRSGVFLSGIGIIFTLFVKSGNVLRGKAGLNL